MAFVKADINYAEVYSREMMNVMPYLSYFADIFGSANSQKYKDLGGKTIKVPNITVKGAHATDRDTISGTINRNFNNGWDTVELQMDRSWETAVDPMDIDETNETVTIANITKAFTEQQKVPEMDAFLASYLATKAIAGSRADTTALTTQNILTKWDDYIAAITKKRFNRDRCIAYVTADTYKALKSAAGITRFIDAGTGIRNVDRNVGALDGVRIIEVPDEIMMTAFTFTEGFTPASGAGQVNMIIVSLDAVCAPIKYELSMVSAPTAFSGGKWAYAERYYYGAHLFAKRADGIYINYTTNPS